MGTAVIGGMVTATCIAIFIIPATFYLMEKMVHRFKKETKTQPVPATGDFKKEETMILRILLGLVLGGFAGFVLSFLTRSIGSS
jgi:hypothetical protein